MKKPNTIKLLFFVALAASTLLSCSKDDGGNDPFADVPKGEIVPVEERDQTLTGFSELREEEQIWWTHVVSIVDIDCGEQSDFIEEESIGYIAFKPDGEIYIKYDADDEGSSYGKTWEWENEDKDAMIIQQGGQSAVFELRELNDNGVVYASDQSQEGCDVLTWEQFKK